MADEPANLADALRTQAARAALGLPGVVPVTPLRPPDPRPEHLYVWCACGRRVVFGWQGPAVCTCGRGWHVLLVMSEAPT